MQTANIYPHGTWKKPTGINIQTVDAAAQTIYNLQGVRINAKFENLPAGVYIVNGKKVLKKIKTFYYQYYIYCGWYNMLSHNKYTLRHILKQIFEQFSRQRVLGYALL